MPCFYLNPEQDNVNQELQVCIAEALYDVDSIVADPEDVARIEKIIGRPLTDEDISECGQRPITELRFLDISREGSWAALRYHGGDSEPDAAGARVQFQVLLFHLHENGWKLVKSGSITHPKFTKSGELVTIDMSHMADRLRLPSQRDNAK